MDTAKIYEAVQDRYSAAAHSTDTGYSQSVAKSFGYTEEELLSIPKEANLGLSCGNPLALASLRKGETVVDLGSGAGFDAFLAANNVGPTGKVYGVDMNKDMLARANKSRAECGKDNVSFVESKVTNIALDSGIADCIISNCVINLVPEKEKQLAFNEMFRLLKVGGRLAISDTLLKKSLPEKLKSSLALYVGCVAGASQVADYETYLKTAGFRQVMITDTNADLNVYIETNADGTKRLESDPETQCCVVVTRDDSAASCQTGQCCSDESTQDGSCEAYYTDEELRNELQGQSLNDLAGSYKVFAVKS